jgi:hypothetical protein
MSRAWDLKAKAFDYFYGLTWNVAECYGSVCHVKTRSIMKFESVFFLFFSTIF